LYSFSWLYGRIQHFGGDQVYLMFSVNLPHCPKMIFVCINKETACDSLNQLYFTASQHWLGKWQAGFVIGPAGAGQADTALLSLEWDLWLLLAAALAGEPFTQLLPNLGFSVHAFLRSSSFALDWVLLNPCTSLRFLGPRGIPAKQN